MEHNVLESTPIFFQWILSRKDPLGISISIRVLSLLCFCTTVDQIVFD